MVDVGVFSSSINAADSAAAGVRRGTAMAPGSG